MHLDVPDGLAEMRFHAILAFRAHRQLGDLIVEIDKALDDHAPGIHTTAAGGVMPRGLDLFRPVHLALALAGRRHHRLDHAGVADAGVNR